MTTLSELLDDVRDAALPGIRAQGTKLARAGAVVVESRDEDEVVLRVRAPGRPVAFTAVLHPRDGDWECDCPGRVDPCEHVMAAVIAAQQAEGQGAPLAQAAQRFGRVLYRFTRLEGGLGLARAVALPDGTETPLTTSLAALLANPAEAARIQVEQHDLVADRLLERGTRLALPPERLARILETLEPARSVLLDGLPVAMAPEPVTPTATLEDQGEALVLTLRRDPRVDEVVAPGVALCGDALARLGATELSGDWLEQLPAVRTFSMSQLGELSAQVLPELARQLPVRVTSARVPRIDRALKPRVVLDLKQAQAELTVLATLVYGAPPQVRIDGTQMTYLQGAVPVRDPGAESKLLHQLRSELDLLPGRRVWFQGAEAQRFAQRLRAWRGGLTGDAAHILSPEAQLQPALSLHDQPGDGVPSVNMGLEFVVRGGDQAGQHVDASAVVSAWREGLGLVPLSGGGWAALPHDWLAKHGQQVADLLAARGEGGTLANHALPQLAELCDALETPRPPSLQRLRPLAEGFEHLGDPELPADLHAELRPYQRAGVAWLQFLKAAGVGGVLADDMGLGKTLQALCAMGPGSLVVCPTSVLPNWAAEAARFRPGLRVCTYHGPGRALDPAADLTLTTYAILRLDAAALAARTWETLVLDEAQAIKNPDSQVARAAYPLKAKLRLALSGTPVENRLEELWSVMHFANPGLLGGRRDFDAQTARPMGDGDLQAARRLRQRIKPFVLRRLKQEVAKDLPPRAESVLHVTLDDRERAVYDAILAATRAEVVRLLGEGGNVLKALEALLRLRQAACHTGLVPGQAARRSSKVSALLEALDTVVAEGHKALVFSQWTSLLDLIEPELRAAGMAFTRLDGATANRGEVVSRFQSAGGPPVMLLSLKAGGTGLNLTAADHVFLVDPWWNPAVEEQAAARAHRIGQDNPVMVYRLVSQGTVEERILLLQDKKRALFEAALGAGDGGVAAGEGLTRDDLLALFA